MTKRTLSLLLFKSQCVTLPTDEKLGNLKQSTNM